MTDAAPTADFDQAMGTVDALLADLPTEPATPEALTQALADADSADRVAGIPEGQPPRMPYAQAYAQCTSPATLATLSMQDMGAQQATQDVANVIRSLGDTAGD